MLDGTLFHSMHGEMSYWEVAFDSLISCGSTDDMPMHEAGYEKFSACKASIPRNVSTKSVLYKELPVFRGRMIGSSTYCGMKLVHNGCHQHLSNGNTLHS